jgi:hypothetical protein
MSKLRLNITHGNCGLIMNKDRILLMETVRGGEEGGGRKEERGHGDGEAPEKTKVEEKITK